MLWKLQGTQVPVTANVGGQEIITHLKIKEEGTLSRSEFDKVVTELVNFLEYVGEPVQLERQRLGKYVLFYFLIFIAIAYLLKKEYWKDID